MKAYDRPNYRFPDIAYWHRIVITNDGEQKRESIDEQPFRCLQREYHRREKEPLIKGAIASADTNLLLQTDFDLSEMEQDDCIIFDNKEWSVADIQSLRSTKGFKTYEWVVLCR